MEESTLQRKVTVIPATKPLNAPMVTQREKLRVAAYCRVSTDSEEQLNSYEAQKTYYAQLIAEKDEWELAGIYADEGISGTSMKKRTEFNRMIAACKRGRIDLIITKSLSRFARNTVDCLNTVRMLKSLGIGVIFEKENINTLTESSEFLITLFSSFAQAESESLSKNVAWGLRKSMEAGNVNIPYKRFLGYRKGADGLPEIVPEEAEIVRYIFRRYLEGASLGQLKEELELNRVPTKLGSYQWSKNTIQNILINEKYAGDALLQKTYITDCISKTTKKNTGELPMYYVENHHEPIISRAIFQLVQEEMTRRKSKRRVAEKNVKTEQGKYSGKYALSERIVCGECGSRYRRVTWNIRGKKRIVWRCISRLENGKKYCHNSPTIDEDTLHAAILKAVNEYLAANEVKAETLKIAEASLNGAMDRGENIATLKARFEEIHAEQLRMVDLLLEYMDDTELNMRMIQLTAEKQVIEKQIEQIEANAKQNEAEVLRIKELETWAKEHGAGFKEYDDLFTRKLIKELTIFTASSIKIKFIDDSEIMKNNETIG